AEEQNKIALFEKRYEAYYALTKYLSFAYLLDKADLSDKNCGKYFYAISNGNDKTDHEIARFDILNAYTEVHNKLKMTEHLFDIEIAVEIQILDTSLFLLIQTDDKSDSIETKQQEFIKQAKKVEKECVPSIKKLLSLK
ncbi:MAG: hypothetical protein IJF16_12505, partial [Clostridia bacterium]|nr:hypothetical protein [Clostridia bacterium]